ncbi:MAG TPA: 2-oxoacid:ferredoxin oxidoreductase subunit beta [Candidatus Omnitrophota bacterium]|nr:2-oxoacid:ferredoxin oxidoreductase subunit beta [Candidatus Omnitrophota bacterium]HRZ14123.1 2-oxoacid:ferredoxin oxidoreductase subunit beta [Candidatus Omnitrophota bacterium]
MDTADFKTQDEIAWCPGCGNFGILNAVKKALAQLGKPPQELMLVSGIGQAAKLPHYIKANCFNGLHGRALPVATGIKIANRQLTVLVTTGDGDCYGEGGNHFIHAIRRNIDITVIVHDNQIYGLTKGQASPTTDEGLKTAVQTGGVINAHLSPLTLAIAAGAGFVARGFSRDSESLSGLILAGIRHKGFALIDVLQPCVTFNKKNTHEWYSQRVYQAAAQPDYRPADLVWALTKSLEWGERIPLGVLYQADPPQPDYSGKSGVDALAPLVNLVQP